MLVLSRRPEEAIVIGDEEAIVIGDGMVRIQILGIDPHQVRIGISAGSEWIVLREELYQTRQANHDAAQSELASAPPVSGTTGPAQRALLTSKAARHAGTRHRRHRKGRNDAHGSLNAR